MTKKNRIKVLYIATAFARNESDAITPWLTKTIRNLQKRGFKVDVFTSSYKGMSYNNVFGIDIYRFRYFFSSFERLTHEEMTIERMKKGILYKILPLFYIILGTIAIVKHCMKKDYDIIHVHWPFPHFLFGYIASKICKAKLISTFHSAGLHYIEKSKLNLKPFIKWVINASDIITVNSSYTGKKLTHFHTQNIRIIPFGAAIEIKEKQETVKTKKGIRILFVGRLVERKGVQYLLEAYKILKEEGIKDIQTIIVGDGNRKNYLVNKRKELGLSKSDIEFTGKISESELIKQYRLCDIFVLPAIVDSKGDTEGLGVVLLEAMSFKKPVIGSRVGGITDIIKDKETGLLVQEKSPKQLSEAIEFLINNPAERRKIAERGFVFQEENFNWDQITDLLIRCYLSV